MGSSCLLVALLISQVPPASPPQPVAADPVIAVWYRGSPAGMPREEDLAAIRAQGFTAVIWPASQSSAAGKLLEMASRAGLRASIHAAPLTSAVVAPPPERVDIVVSHLVPKAIPALAWRAIARGVRSIAFDPGVAAGAGLVDEQGLALPWVAPAAAIARHLTFNGRLFNDLRPGPTVSLHPPVPPGVDVVLLQAPRVWVLISTNTSAVAIAAIADLPSSVAPALWTSLLDGSEMSMLSRPIGPRWTFKLGPGEAGVWLIDR
jgi:hypothetical protein